MSVGDEHLHDEFSFKNSRHITLSILLAIFAISVNVLFFSLKNTVFKASADVVPPPSLEQYNVKVLSLRYFPMITPEASGSAEIFDATRTGMPGGSTIDSVRSRVNMLRDKTVNALHDATKYHGYKDPLAQPSLQYQVVDEKEFLKPIPVSGQFKSTQNSQVWSADHFKVLSGTDQTTGISNICDYVDNQNVKEVWIWFYHTNEVAPVESNMAPKNGGAFGSEGYKDVSNSQGLDDLPRCAKTYTVYDFNYTRDVSLHTFGHHLERIFGYVDSEVFGNYTKRGPNGTTNACGNVHNPPNIDKTGFEDNTLEGDYDYGNEQTRQSNCQNWKPDGTGAAEPVNCHTWQGSGACNSWEEVGQLQYQKWWMQNMPGMNNGLTYRGKPMSNWWKYIGDWDNLANQKPSVRITSPQAGFIATSDISVAVDATHPNGIEKVEFYIDNQETPIATDTSAPFTTTLNLNQIRIGDFLITVKAVPAGKSFVPQGSANVLVRNNVEDGTLPTLRVNSPIQGKVYDTNKILFDIEAVDNQQIAFASVSAENETNLNYYVPQIWFNTQPLKETKTLIDGAYTLTFYVVDQSGNRVEAKQKFFVKADPDNDGFTTKLEDFMGTSSVSHCGTNAWPPDFNNDKKVNVADQGLLASNYAPKGASNYNKRYDFSMDGVVNVADMGLFSKYVNKTCSGPTALIQPVITQPISVQCGYGSNVVNGITYISVSGLPVGEFGIQAVSSESIVWGTLGSFVGEGRFASLDYYENSITICSNSFNFPSGWQQ